MPDDRQRLLFSGAAGSFVTRGVGVGLLFVVQVALARLVGAASFGAFSVGATAIGLLSLAGKLGLDTATLRFVPAYRAQGRHGLAHGFLRWSRRRAALTSLLLLVPYFATLALLHGRLPPETWRVFAVAAPALPLLVLLLLYAAAVQSLKRVVLSQVPLEIVRPLLLIAAAAGAIWLLEWPADGVTAMAAECVALAGGAALAALLARRVLPPEVAAAAPETEPGRWWRTALPLSLVSALTIVLNDAGTLFVGSLRDVTEAGIFRAAVRITLLIGFGLRAVNSIAAPMIAELHANGEREELQRIVALASGGLTLFSLAMGGVLALFGGPILAAFGPEFVLGREALWILIAGQVFNGLAGPTAMLMTMTGHQREAAWIMAGGVALFLVLATLLVPGGGAAGAALATAAGLAFWNLAMWIFIRRRLGIEPTVLALLRPAILRPPKRP